MSAFISIVIPTRNRPEYVRYAIESLARQTHGEFETIVSDNHTGRSCKAEFDRFADSRFRYVVPPRPLAMHEHWEFALDQARGDFVGVMVDKTALLPSALARLASLARSHPADAYCWRSDGYDLLEEENGNMGPGRYTRFFAAAQPRAIDLTAAIRQRLGFAVRRGTEGARYFHGKICFGAYSRALIRRIKEAFGQVFVPIAPDYTSMIAALAVADRMVDIGQSLQISMNTRVSNGMLCATQSPMALKFLREIDPTLALLDRLPIAGLYTSVHNMVAHDYTRLEGAPIPPDRAARIDPANLALQAREDLDGVQVWASEDERRGQFALLQRFADLPPRPNAYLSKMRAIRNSLAGGMSTTVLLEALLRKAAVRMPPLRRVVLGRGRFASVIDAAAAADRP